MLLSEARRKLHRINCQLGQLNRNWLWNFERIDELKRERRDLEKFIANQEALNKSAAWIWEV